ncbi:ABC transporter permease [Micromonospora aurantiaca (nom. illeg.)]|uniref:ABC transporter permease n=1 Tax=Micromonospora aurantiaca (nom. illeg.) TaxID=47850 RepID=UPI001656B839|nr:ABC transporter permease [Micromonospora aurantiaca]MBC9005958.1 ABC transporter permease [Micromonospora aurantiaca]
MTTAEVTTPTPVGTTGGARRTRRATARYLAGRGAEYGTVLALALVINFALPRALPGGPLRTLGGGENVGALSAEDQRRILAEHGLDRSLWEQFLAYLGDVFTLDLGTSFGDGQPVSDAIMQALPWTMLLVGSSIVCTALIGIALGALAGLRRRRGKGSSLLSTALLFDSIPSFWLGMLFIAFFGVYLGALPTFGVGEGWDSPASLPRHLVLPVLTLTLTGFGQLFLVTRASMLSVLAADHVEHARARGVPRGRLLRRHALRPALLPVHTVLMTEIGFLVGGALVVETVFAYPGLGRVTFDAIQARDFPLMQGTFLVLTVAVVVMNAIADATYALIDPRVRTAATT